MGSVFFAFSMTSAQATMALFSEDASQCLAHKQWNNLDGQELAEQLTANYLYLLSKVKDAKITKIFGVEGPGSFTGLRISSSFLKGVSAALNVPLVGISSYDLFGEAFAFSLRPAKAVTLTLEECIEREYKFLEVQLDQVLTVSVPTTKKVLGLKSAPFWPNLEELHNGVKRSLERNTFELNYGYTPEFTLAKTL